EVYGVGGAIAQGPASTTDTSVQLPTALKPGSYTFRVRQIDRATNGGGWSLPEPFTITAPVSNTGELAAGAFRLGIYLSSDTTIDANDVLLGSINVAGLTVGANTQVSQSVEIPAGTLAGTYHIGTWADDLGSVQESGRESNNTAIVSGSIQVP
ncbi:MAG TPA: CARDB domain-containing protein, partial [Planctomycetota bacterium]|nr:CARDB domain-containing protein [Planctomycetota bacterium]